MKTSSIEILLKNLADSGCYGNPDDFFAWVNASNGSDVDRGEFENAFQGLIRSGEMKEVDSMTSSYRNAVGYKFESSSEFTVSALYEHVPIQFARSRLDSFLIYHNIDPEEINIILIGATEGFENAVKYNNGKTFQVHFWIKQGEFNLVVKNSMKHVSVEDNIKAGKFDSATTLMRGMLVMNKIFDHMDLNFSENYQLATLVAMKKL